MIFLYRLSVAFSLITVIADLGKYATFHWLISWLPYSRTLLKNSGLYRIVRYRYIGVNQTFHEQHNIHHTRSNENDNIGKSPDYG